MTHFKRSASLPDFSFAKQLIDCKTHFQRVRLIESASIEELESLFEIAKNVLAKNIELEPKIVKKLSKFEKVLVFIADSEKNLKRKIKFLKNNPIFVNIFLQIIGWIISRSI